MYNRIGRRHTPPAPVTAQAGDLPAVPADTAKLEVDGIKKTAALIIFLALVLLMALPILRSPQERELPSYRLKTQQTKDGNTTRIDYIDSEGKLSFASDKRYATIIKTYEDGHVVLEQYFDAEGNPAVQSLGHCALARQYSPDGLSVVITPLDEAGQPFITSSGYNSIHRSYNDQRLADTDTYYIDGEQVQHKNGYYAYRRAYDENGRLSEKTYLDENGALTVRAGGYARVTRSFNEAGKVAYEYCFDAEGSPAAVFSGCCGRYREYDEHGNTTLSTYLGADGLPMNGRRGYATVVRTFNYNGSEASVRYFDAEGEPVTAGRNQYGIEYVNGQGIFLDKNGERMLRIDNFLDTHPPVVLLFGIVLTAAALAIRGKGRIAFILLYILFIFVMTLAYREAGTTRQSVRLFWSYKQFFTSSSLRQEVLNNIWLFVPLGAILYSPGHPRRWLWAIGLSAAIEAAQRSFGIGLCELDDVISNALGAWIGCFAASQFAWSARARHSVKGDET